MANSIDELLNRAIAAFNNGEIDRARSLAGEVLDADGDNLDANDLLGVQPTGELRRMTVMFCDVVGSTEMSERLEPETYRTIIARYQTASRAVIEKRYGGSIMSNKGDGILAAFGFPVAHENDADRGVRAGLDVLDAVERVAEDVERVYGEHISVRIAVHKGIVFLDLDEKDLYGFAVNVAARLEGLAEPNTLLISEEVKRLIGDRFELEAHAARAVKGVTAPLVSYTVLGEGIGVGPRANGPIVGRSEQLARLNQSWARARSGDRQPGQCVTLVGDAGIGKSRLAAALAEMTEKDGGVIVEILGSPLETHSGLWPIRRLVMSRCGFARDSDSNERLHRLRNTAETLALPDTDIALLATLIGIPPSAGYEAVESDVRRLRDEIDEAVMRFVSACFEGRHGLLLCEDAHWFDEQTRGFVLRAAKELPPSVLTAVTSRELEAVPRGPLVNTVGLSPLEDDAALELLAALRADGYSDEDLREIVKRGDGIPLFLEELVRMTEGAGVVAPAPPGATSSSAVPEVLYEPLVARLNVSPAASAVAAAVAVIAAPTGRDLLGAVAEVSRAQLDVGLETLLDARILERVEFGRDVFRFRHELLREVAYDLQPPTRRRALHGRVGDALVAAQADEDAIQWQRVAAHFEAAARALDAVDAYERASEQARRRGGLVEAKLLLTKAIDLLTADDTSTHAHEIRLRLARGYIALTMEGHTSSEAAIDYERCLELSMLQGTGDEVLATIFSLWSYYSARAELDRADELLELLRGFALDLPPIIRALVMGSEGVVAWYRGDLTRAFDLFAHQADGLGGAGAEADFSRWWFIPVDPTVTMQSIGMMAAMQAGDVARIERLIDIARRMCAALPFPRGAYTLAAFLVGESWLRVELDDYDNAMRIVDEIVELSTRYGFDSWAIVAATQQQVFEGLRLIYEGRADSHQRELSGLAATVGTYMSMWKSMEQWVFVTYYTTVQGILHAAAGEKDLALAAYEEARAIAKRTGMYFYEAETIRHLARLQPTPDEQEQKCREALALAQQQGSLLYELHAALDLAWLTDDVTDLAQIVPRFAATVSFPALEAARDLVSR